MLKKEFKRIEKEMVLLKTSNTRTDESYMGFFKLGNPSGIDTSNNNAAAPGGKRPLQKIVTSTINATLNSLSTLEGRKGPSEMILAESSIETVHDGALLEDSIDVALNFRSDNSLLEPSVDSVAMARA